MLVFGPSGTRSYPTDRAPTTVSLAGTAAPAAGGATVAIASYTCPANRRAQLVIDGNVLVTVALAAGQQGTVFGSDGVPVNSSGFRVTPAAAAVGVTTPLDPHPVQLRGGETVQVRGQLTAGAGTVSVSGAIQGVEYDA